MESLGDVLNIITPGVWMASVDLQDAYYTIPVHPDHQKYLTFSWQHKYYKFTCLPNGYAQAPMIFTKLLKHPFSFLRRRGHHSIIYIDDACYNNVYETASLFQKLGFTINLRKSVLHPTQQVEFLGFILDSRLMTIKLSRRRHVVPGTFSLNTICCICCWYVDCSLTCCPTSGTLIEPLSVIKMQLYAGIRVISARR